MARRTPEEVYATLLAAGWPPDAAVTMTAIAGAESGWNNTALGDVSLQTSEWGPSYGLFQIRTLKTATDSGGPRDIARLSSGDLAQAQAALQIAEGGLNFSPWTVYATGAYQVHLDAARRAAARVGGGDGGLDPGGILPTVWDGVQSAAGGLRGLVLGGARNIALEALVVLAGLGLVVAGVWRLGAGRAATGRTGWQRAGRRAVGI